MMPTFVFRCPATGYKVQGFIAEEIADHKGEAFVPVDCNICSKWHLMSTKTGRILGGDKDRLTT